MAVFKVWTFVSSDFVRDSIVSDSEEKNTHNLVSTENKSNDNSDATIPSTIKNTADSAENITETTSDFDTTETNETVNNTGSDSNGNLTEVISSINTHCF